MATLSEEHFPEKIASRLSKKPTPSYLRDWIYGGIDGAITTFAIVSGVVGGQLSSTVILILGAANLIADGFSMAVSNYLGTKSEIDQFQRYKQLEDKHIQLVPEGETEEVRQIFRKKGIQGEALEEVVKAITSDKKLWVETMLKEEYGLSSVLRFPLKAAVSTFLAFVVFGFVPLVAYVFTFPNAFFWSCILTGAVFFVIGSIKSRFTAHTWWKAGFETLIIGALAASLAYIIGFVLSAYISR